MAAQDLRADTEPGYYWSCCVCGFSTLSINAAVQHCDEASADYPAHEHTLHELPRDRESVRRGHARRVIYCRDRFGYCQQPRVARNRWRVIEGRWEIRGVTA